MKPRISVIIPFLNESGSFAHTGEMLVQPLLGLTQFEIEVIFVDDGSTDDSIDVLRRVDFQGVKATVVSLSRNFGSHSAIFAGMSVCSGDYVTVLSGDFQDDVNVIERLFDELSKGNDIVFPLRKEYAQPGTVKFFSNLYASLMRRYAIANYPKQNFDAFMISDKVRKQVLNTYELNSSLFLHVMTLGYRQAFITYDRRERKAGKSKWTLRKKVKLLIDSFVAFSYAPIRFVTFTGFAFFLFGIFWTVYISFRKLMWNDLEPGWPMLTSIILLGFGLTNISLGIIAEYLWRTLDASRKKPLFIIDHVVELSSSNSFNNKQS